MKSKRLRIKIEVRGGMVQDVKCTQPAECVIYDRDNAAIGERVKSKIHVGKLRGAK